LLILILPKKSLQFKQAKIQFLQFQFNNKSRLSHKIIKFLLLKLKMYNLIWILKKIITLRTQTRVKILTERAQTIIDKVLKMSISRYSKRIRNLKTTKMKMICSLLNILDQFIWKMRINHKKLSSCSKKSKGFSSIKLNLMTLIWALKLRRVDKEINTLTKWSEIKELIWTAKFKKKLNDYVDLIIFYKCILYFSYFIFSI